MVHKQTSKQTGNPKGSFFRLINIQRVRGHRLKEQSRRSKSLCTFCSRSFGAHAGFLGGRVLFVPCSTSISLLPLPSCRQRFPNLVRESQLKELCTLNCPSECEQKSTLLLLCCLHAPACNRSLPEPKGALSIFSMTPSVGTHVSQQWGAEITQGSG